eukprot:COSAG02_NODE_703_length_18313_cov_58.533652_14_plen_319_part_00
MTLLGCIALLAILLSAVWLHRIQGLQPIRSHTQAAESPTATAAAAAAAAAAAKYNWELRQAASGGAQDSAQPITYSGLSTQAELSARWALKASEQPPAKNARSGGGDDDGGGGGGGGTSVPAVGQRLVRTARDWWPCECLVDVVEVTSSVPSSSNSRHGHRLVGASDDAGSYPSHTWGQCASASADAECATLLTAKPCATEANELRLQVLLQQADDVYVQVTAVATGCNVSAHELAVTLVSSTWIVPAMKISLHQLPPSLVSSQSQKSLLSADAALFRARLRPSWLPLEADAYQVHAKLIINGVSAERLRRTSWCDTR